MLKTIKHYEYEPVYFLTYVQNSCYSEILVNALWAKFDDNGEIDDFFKFYLYIPEGEYELVMIR